MERGEVASFVRRASAAIEESPEMGVRNTQLRIVEPFLSLLDWDVRSGAVEAAFETPSGRVVDYALVPRDRPGAFVCVRSCDASLSVEDRDALVAAMTEVAVRRGVLTNGREFFLMVLPDSAVDEGDDQLASNDVDGASGASGDVETLGLELEDLVAHTSVLDAFSFTAIESLTAGESRRAVEALVEADETAVTAVTDAVVDVADADVSDTVEPLARRFLDAVVSELAPNEHPISDRASAVDGSMGDQETTDSVSATKVSKAESTPEPSESATAQTGTATSDPSTRPSQTDLSPGEAGSSSADAEAEPTGSGASQEPHDADGSGAADDAGDAGGAEGTDDTEYVMRFFDAGRSVGAVGNPDVDVAVRLAVEYLLDERGLGPRLQFPYAPGEDDRAFLHREPVHPDGSSMQEVLDMGGLYLYTGQTLDEKQSRVKKLAERSGLRVMFTGDWP